MTDEELAAIEARCAAAQPGPWFAVAGPPACIPERLTMYLSGGGTVYAVHRDASDPRFDSTHVLPEREPDATFIAAARSDVPALLAEIARLRAIIAGPPIAARTSRRFVSDPPDAADEVLHDAGVFPKGGDR